MTYFPSKFDGINVFQQNRGRSLVVEHKVHLYILLIITEMCLFCRLLDLVLTCMGTCIL